MARRLRLLLIALIGLLYLISVPWYREGGAAPGIWLGLPDWVAVALGCYLVAAALNAVAWLLTDVPDLPEEEPPSEPSGDRASR
jgi:hypothetical protein